MGGNLEMESSRKAACIIDRPSQDWIMGWGRGCRLLQGLPRIPGGQRWPSTPRLPAPLPTNQGVGCPPCFSSTTHLCIQGCIGRELNAAHPTPEPSIWCF